MSKSQNLKPSPKTPLNLRLYATYNNTDFITDAIGIHKKIQTELLKKKVIKVPADFFICNRDVVVGLGNRKILESYGKIIDFYGVSDDEFWAFFEVPGSVYPAKMTNAVVGDVPVSFDLTESDAYLTVRIYPWAKKTDLDNRWNAIELLLKTRTGYKKQYKGPQEPELIYAVYLARKKSKKFSEIADEINRDSLPGYKKKTSNRREWDQWSLIDHYNRYKHIVER